MSDDAKESSSGQCNDSVGSSSINSNNSSNGSSFEIGKVMEKVQECKYGNNNKVGTLLIASEAISWQSSNNHNNFFGMFGNPRLILPFKSIKDIYIHNNDSIIIKLENNKEHSFSGFSKTDIDKKFDLLNQILSNHEHTTTTTTTSSTNSTTTHSTNGSHLEEEDHKCSNNVDHGDERKQNKLALFNAIQEEIDGTGEEYKEGGGLDVDSAVKEALIISKSMKVCMENMNHENDTNNNNNSSSSGDIPILSGGKIGETEEDYLAIATIAAMAEFRSVSRYISDKKKALRKLEDDLTMEEKKTPPPKTEMKTAWSECRESMIHSFKESVVEVSPSQPIYIYIYIVLQL